MHFISLPANIIVFSFPQYCLVAFLILVEAKLKTWAVKYGKEQEVQQILTEYRSFVGTRNIFQEFDRAFHEMQQVSEAYKKDTELSKGRLTFFMHGAYVRMNGKV